MIKNIYSGIALLLFAFTLKAQTNTAEVSINIVQAQQPASYTIECQDELVFLDFIGAAYIFPELLLVEETAYDSLLDWSVDQSNFNCENIGANTVIVSAMNLDSIISTCAAILEVIDEFPPIVQCEDSIQISLSQEGEFINLDSQMLINDLQDNCSAFVLDISPSQLSIDNIGETIVEVTVQDEAGNIASCKSIIQLDITLAGKSLLESEPPFLSPNPSKGWFRIERTNGISPNAELSIFTSTGEEILQYSKEYEDAGFSINLATPGLYLIKVNDRNEQQLLRVLIE